MRQKSGVIVPCVDISELLLRRRCLQPAHNRQTAVSACLSFSVCFVSADQKHTLHPFMVNRQEGLLSVFTNRYDSVQISGQLHFKCSHRLSCHERRVTGYDRVCFAFRLFHCRIYAAYSPKPRLIGKTCRSLFDKNFLYAQGG